MIAVVTSYDAALAFEYYPIVSDMSRKGCKIKMMAPINRSHLVEIKRVAEVCEVRNIDEAYPKTVVIDRKHLVHLRYPPTDSSDISTRFKDMFYTNDPLYVDGMYRMLNSLWGRSTTLEDFEKRPL